MISHCGLPCIFPMANDIKHNLMCLIAICVSSMVKCLVMYLSIFYFYCLSYLLLSLESSFTYICLIIFFTIVSLLIHVHGRPLHLFKYFIFFISIMLLSTYKFCLCFITSTLKYFFLFWGIYKWYCGFDFSICALYWYFIARQLFMFIAYPVTLMYSFINSRNFS